MPSSITINTILNHYRIEEFIAITPLGELYRAVDERSGKSIALTILPKSIEKDPDALKEFELNSVRLQGISHPNLNKYHGLQKTPHQTFITEDWVDGPSFTTVRERGRLKAEETLFIAKSICGGLEALHKQNLLHLHLAPELIHINKRGEVILSGIAGAKALNAKAKSKPGKYQPLYTPPEQFLEQPLAPAADMYALAVMLYELTTGVWINGKNKPRSSETIRKTHLDSTPPAPATLNQDLPDNFSRMILWALRKNPEDRLKTTTELLSSLALAAQTSPDKIPPRAHPELTPVLSNILSDWQFLPPSKAKTVSTDAIPLEERLATLTPPKSKPVSRLGFVPVFLFVIIASFLALFVFVRPAAEISLPTPIIFTSIVMDFTPEPSATPSPRPTLTKGGRIVFTCTRGDYNQICMINRDGTDLAQLTDMAASNYYPVFTPDAGSVLFASNRAGPGFDFYILNFMEREVFQVTVNVGNVISPDFSPDGRTIVFANRVGNGLTAIWMVNSDGLNPRLVYTGTGDIVSVSWSPDGEKIAYAMSRGVPQEYEIFTMDASGRNHLQISQRLQGIGGIVDWSPDGASLLVHAGPFGDKDIFKIDVATGAYVQLTDGGNNAGAAFSPNGQFIVFNSLRNNDQADLYIMRADGTDLQQLTNNPEPDWGARWIE